MYLDKSRYFFYFALVWALFSYKTVLALEFTPGVGYGLEYTDNAKLRPTGEDEDLISIAYVGAHLEESEGPLQYKGTASLTKQSYNKDSFDDERYLDVLAEINWEMIRDRFNWVLNEQFSQRTVVALDSATPDNLQDSNVFQFGAKIFFPVSARQSFSITPAYHQYYYEQSNTNNDQLLLLADWKYQIYRSANIGMQFSERRINYTQVNFFGETLPDTTFRKFDFVVSGERPNSNYTINIGATNIQREGDETFTGATGGLYWNVDVSSRSELNAQLSSDLTDASSASSTATGTDDVQVIADVIRDSLFSLGYARRDEDLHSKIWTEYHQVQYETAILDQNVQTTGVRLSIPGSQYLETKISAIFKRAERVDSARLDKTFVVNTGFSYRFSRLLSSEFIIKYSTKESTKAAENYDEVSIFASLVYGFGNVTQSQRAN